MRDFAKVYNKKNKIMSIQLQAQPVTANAALSEADVKAIVAALSSVVTLPQGESFDSVVALNVTIQPTGTGVLNVRFNK
jgi:hypothetical protein